MFTNNGLKITIEANKKVVNFLDVTLDLNKEVYEPYTKPNNTPLYVHRDSNHPPSILRNIPLAIKKRLSEISSTREAFERATPEYQEVLNKSGYDHQLRYQPTTAQSRPGPRKRQCNITWYNPPYSQSVATNVGKKLLGIVNDTFKKDHPLRKIFNGNTLKLSYSCMTNLGSNINAHRKSVINEKPRSPEKTCNCRSKPTCLLNGKCLTSNIIYQATVKNDGWSETYIGLTANEFKTRYHNHTTSFRHESKRHSMELSKHFWSLKDKNKDYRISWKIVARTQPYSNTIKKCNLCLAEKILIICKPKLCTLNKRNKLSSSCRHANKFLLTNT